MSTSASESESELVGCKTFAYTKPPVNIPSMNKDQNDFELVLKTVMPFGKYSEKRSA